MRYVPLINRPSATINAVSTPFTFLALHVACSPLTGCKFSVAHMLRSSAQVEGNRIRRERCAKKNAGDSEPAKDTDMWVIAMFSGPCAADALTARGSVFSHDFKGLE
jgi:hypothetical protein